MATVGCPFRFYDIALVHLDIFDSCDERRPAETRASGRDAGDRALLPAPRQKWDTRIRFRSLPCGCAP